MIGKLKDFSTQEEWFQVEDVSVDESKAAHLIDGESDEEEDQDVRLGVHPYDKPILLAFQEDKRLLLNIECSRREGKGFRVSISRGGEIYTLPQGDEVFKVMEGIDVVTASLAKFSGSTDHLVLSTRDGYLTTFVVSVDKKGKTFDFRLLHKTLIEDQVTCMIPFSDKLLVPIFGSLVLFGLGKKQLLKQSFSETTPSITKITALANWKNQRVAVGDIRESVTLFLLDKSKNAFLPIADDIVKRHVTTLAFLDVSTILGGDKFGNIWTLRLQSENEKTLSQCFPHAIERLQQLPPVKKYAPNIMECPFKLTLTNMFYVNDIPMNIHILESLQMSDRPAIIYSGLQGTIGCLTPLLSRAEISNFKTIESMMSEADDRFYLKSESEVVHDDSLKEDSEFELSNKSQGDVPEGSYSIVDRDHLRYRSYYAPVRNIVDGDLCERFIDLSYTAQKFLCAESKTLNPDTIIKIINDIRTNCM